VTPLRGSAAPGFLLLPGLDEDRPQIPDDEAHYLTRVCRARAGDPFEATDGRGTVATLRLDSVSPVRAEVLERRSIPRAARAWILCGAPEGDRAEWLVEKLAELAVERWIPVNTERAHWGSAQARPARWQRLVDAALRQSRGAWAMQIDPVSDLDRVLAELPAGNRWLASQDGPPPGLPGIGSGPEIGLIGPAPGFSPGEAARLAGLDFRPVRLAANRLRTETAALAWGYWWAGRALGDGRG
jgi:16S rRNA (uracil1498-N3)-methyltransferase